MNKFKAIIVDDESSARDIIEGLLNRLYPEIEIVAKCVNLDDAVAAIKSTSPDIVFLDIEMPNYAGYEIVNFFDTIDFEIIFVTAYDNYAIKAFEISAVDYLLKPIDIDRLKKSIDKVKQKIALQSIQQNYDVLKENLNQKNLQKIVVPNHGDQKVIPLDTIVAFEAKEAYTTIHTLTEGRFMMSKNLKHFENLLAYDKNFYRSHKSWLIQVPLIQKYSKSDLTIQLPTSLTAKLSKYKKPEFEAIFKS